MAHAPARQRRHRRRPPRLRALAPEPPRPRQKLDSSRGEEQQQKYLQTRLLTDNESAALSFSSTFLPASLVLITTHPFTSFTNSYLLPVTSHMATTATAPTAANGPAPAGASSASSASAARPQLKSTISGTSNGGNSNRRSVQSPIDAQR